MTMNDGAQDDVGMSIALPANVFLNPLDPNVTVEPMVKRKKGQKGQKNTTQMKAVNGHGTSAPPTNLELKRFEARNAICRARLLQERFPSVAAEIPDSISKQELQTLTKKYVSAKVPSHPNQKDRKCSAHQTMMRKIAMELDGKPKAKKKKKAKAPVIAGSSSNVPITIG